MAFVKALVSELLENHFCKFSFSKTRGIILEVLQIKHGGKHSAHFLFVLFVKARVADIKSKLFKRLLCFSGKQIPRVSVKNDLFC